MEWFNSKISTHMFIFQNVQELAMKNSILSVSEYRQQQE